MILYNYHKKGLKANNYDDFKSVYDLLHLMSVDLYIMSILSFNFFT